MHRVFIGIGGNLSPLSHFINIQNRINKSFHSVRFSEWYTTEPYQCGNQPPFLNTVSEFYTEWDAEYLLKVLLEWEIKEGRIRKKPHIYEARPIDLDILLYDQLICESNSLNLPHPKITERKFVLLPLLNLYPDLKDPRSGALYRTFFNKLPEQGVYRFSLKKYN